MGFEVLFPGDKWGTDAGARVEARCGRAADDRIGKLSSEETGFEGFFSLKSLPVESAALICVRPGPVLWENCAAMM